MNVAPGPQRLEEQDPEPGRRSSVDQIADIYRSIPRSARGIGILVLAVVVADATGVRVPGRNYVRAILSDPQVFLAARIFAVFTFAFLILLLAYLAWNVVVWIRNDMWVTRLGPLEPHELHRVVRDARQGLAEKDEVLREKFDREAMLMNALVQTSRRVVQLEIENDQLRRGGTPDASGRLKESDPGFDQLEFNTDE